MPPEGTTEQTADEERLAELGYKQELERAGRVHQLRDLVHDHLGSRRVLHDLRVGVELTAARSRSRWGWPIICLIILTVAFSMAELTSAYPDRGRSLLVGARPRRHRAGRWFTGWFNMLGLIGIVASVDYGARDLPQHRCFGLWGLRSSGHQLRRHRAHPRGDLHRLRGDPAALHAMINIFSIASRRAVQQHLGRSGTCSASLVIIGILVIVPDHHQSADFVFTERINNSGFGGSTATCTGSTSCRSASC